MNQRVSPDQFRSLFPIFRTKVYLNSCSQGALATPVEQAVQQYLQSWHRDGSPWNEWVETCETLRQEFAALVGADADEIAILPSASCAIGAITTSLSFDERPEVALGSFEFPTMAHGWLAQQRRGAAIRRVVAEGHELPIDSYRPALSARTLIVPMTQLCFRNGYRLDVAGLAALCREHGALSLLDDYQSTGSGPLDVRALGVDFMVTGALKYLLGPSGVAFLYVRHALIGGLTPLVTGWFGRANPFAFRDDLLDWSDSARRFEGGSPPVINAYAALAGIRLLRSVGLEAVGAHVAALVTRFADACRHAGFRLLTPADPDRRGPLVVVACTDAPRMVERLAARGLVCSARGNGLRVSFHYYNTAGDVDVAVDALAAEADLIERVDSA
jgi:selenocysteine lyase/cysteine desulfurase